MVRNNYSLVVRWTQAAHCRDTTNLRGYTALHSMIKLTRVYVSTSFVLCFGQGRLVVKIQAQTNAQDAGHKPL